MDIGMVGLGRMGANMTKRLLEGGHRVVVTDLSPDAVAASEAAGAVAASSLADLAAKLAPRRAVWMMVPSGDPVQATLDGLAPHLAPGDIVVDGGNSNYHDSMRRADALKAQGIEYVDCGVSGGIWGLREGFCLMAGGSPEAFAHLEPALKTLAPPDGYAHVGPGGAGHFTKMVHNGIEYGLMQSYAEGLELLQASELGIDVPGAVKAWRHGTVIRSWLLDLLDRALDADPELAELKGWADDSGEGRWTVQEAINLAVPTPAISAALYARFASRQDESPAMKVIAALRQQFGGHAVHT